MRSPGYSLVGWAIVVVAICLAVIMIILAAPVINRLRRRRLQHYYQGVEAEVNDYAARFPRGSHNRSFRAELAAAQDCYSRN